MPLSLCAVLQKFLTEKRRAVFSAKTFAVLPHNKPPYFAVSATTSSEICLSKSLVEDRTYPALDGRAKHRVDVTEHTVA